jgi:two-component system, chemotaxis family, sensor kinase CheA
MSGPDADLAEIFRDETTERLDEMDTALLAVEAGEAGADVVNALFRNAHTVKGAAGMLGLENIQTLAHAVEDVLAAVRDAGVFPAELAAPLLRATNMLRALTGGASEPIGDLLTELEDCRTLVPGRARAAAGSAGGREGAGGPEGGRQGAGGADAARDPGAARAAGEAGEVPAAGETPAGKAPAGKAPATSVPGEAGNRTATAGAGPAGAATRETRATAGTAARPASGRATIRVPAEKIDHLLDVVGEVMQDRRRLAHSLSADSGLPPDVADVLGAGDRMLEELKDSAVGMRTLPLAVITGPLPRAVRDLARGAGKEVEFTVTGEDTELDRVILESLSEPLTHLLRNSIDHGIEPAAQREAAGKPARGRIGLRAEPRGSLVRIVVADDGRGVSPELAAEARRAGSLVDVLTRPGFSTSTEVTDLGGRGVGLDAVKDYVRSLGGSIEIRSEPGQGMEVGLLLPLALALAEVLLFERAGAVYGVPLAVVDEVVTADRLLMLEGRPALAVRGQPLPVADVASILGASAPPLPARPSALVISAGGRRAVVTCDTPLGQEEVVVKPLGPIFAGTQGYLGAALLGDGRIALLIEPALLTRGFLGATGAGAAGVPGPEGGASGPPKVLVVEDSFTVRELQRSILEAAGYPVATARDGQDALAALDREPDVALVVTDIEMPEMDGLELTRAIRADPDRSSLPVVVVTSRGSDEDRRDGIEAGADAFMKKREFNQRALLETVERLVGR